VALIPVIGRGHGGTRAIARTLVESGVYMGEPLNKKCDLVPADDMYEACSVIARHVAYAGDYRWDFSRLHTVPIDPAFERLVTSYLTSVLGSPADRRGWKLPETTLCYPWIVRIFPDARYILWSRDPRDAILHRHLTDDLSQFGIPGPVEEDLLAARAVSWLYQTQIVRDTPRPRHAIDVRLEDFVLRQEATLARLERFLGFTLARIETKVGAVGRWEQTVEPPVFPEFLLRELPDLGYDVPGKESVERTT
jgi:hypothetical protein